MHFNIREIILICKPSFLDKNANKQFILFKKRYYYRTENSERDFERELENHEIIKNYGFLGFLTVEYLIISFS